MLQGQQSLICFVWHKAVLTALWLLGGLCFLLFPWRSPSAAVRFFLLNSSHHVSCFVWVWTMVPIDERSHFWMRIILRTMSIWFLVFQVSVSGCSRNDSGLCPQMWVQKNFPILHRAKMRDTVFLISRDSSLLTLPSMSSKTCVMTARLF